MPVLGVGVLGAAAVTWLVLANVGDRPHGASPPLAVVRVPIDAALADAPAPDAPVTSDAAIAAAPVHREPGTFSIDSSPYATIFLDGHELGVTPIIDRSVPAGRHRLRAVLADGRHKDMALDVPAGRQASPMHLSW